MSIANKTSRYVWTYESVPGTAEIVANNTVTYEFGRYNDECGKWNSPFVEQTQEPYWVQASRTPKLIDAETKYPTFSHVFNPVTAQFLAWMLKLPVDADPAVTIASLEAGLTYPLTIRLEEAGGTVPCLTQAVGCYCIGLTAKAERGKDFLVEVEFAWEKMEDLSNTARPILTTPPVMPGHLLTKPYNGNPIVIWDSGGTPISLTPVWRFDFQCQQDFEISTSDEGAVQTVYTYKYAPVKIIMSAVFEAQDIWDDYVNRVGTYEMTLQLKKHDGTSNILFTFHNCRIQTTKKMGKRNEGHYGSVCTIIAEKITATCDWFTETSQSSPGTFATHWKAAV